MMEREQFMQAKIKELKSFFENGVWEFAHVKDTKTRTPNEPSLQECRSNGARTRTEVRERKLDLWSEGATDQDALEAKVETTAPTTSRLSRSMFLSLVCHFEVVRMDS